MTLLTFVTPIAPYHKHLVDKVVACVKAQTIPCEHILIYDDNENGTGWARNRGLEQVKTDFVSFLDCDDEIHPSFAEKLLRAYEPGHYCYCDWRQGDAINGTDEPWTLKGDWHVVTALIPTEAAKAMGGFDEKLPAVEDTFFSGHSPARVSVVFEFQRHYSLMGQGASAPKPSLEHPNTSPSCMIWWKGIKIWVAVVTMARRSWLNKAKH